MPNIQCDKCKLYIDDICKNKKERNKFIDLVNKRAKRISGIIYNVSPGITHNEISKHIFNGKQCDGVVRYHHFSSTTSKYFTSDMFSSPEKQQRDDEWCCFNLFHECLF